jgi:hypothetical protein
MELHAFREKSSCSYIQEYFSQKRAEILVHKRHHMLKVSEASFSHN